MKRDIDLARQLLLDIEARGADCSMSALRTDANHDAEERARYHLQLLVDAGYLKEVDRTSNGVPCLRLTDAGHELIELTRSERRWRDAKCECRERTGGFALTVVRRILLAWALAPRTRRRRRRYRPTSDALLVDDANGRFSPPLTIEPVEVADYGSFYGDWRYAPEDQVRYVRVGPEYRNGWRTRQRDLPRDFAGEGPFETSLPEYLI